MAKELTNLERVFRRPAQRRRMRMRCGRTGFRDVLHGWRDGRPRLDSSLRSRLRSALGGAM